jgi:predicted dehydrogenase
MKPRDGVVLVGGVGTGRIFRWAHLRVYPHLLGKARLVSFYDVNPKRAQEAREKYARLLEDYAAEHPESAEAARTNARQLTCHGSLEELLEKVDVVDVCTHARNRMAIAIAAFERGVHSMLEKPMARTWIEADRAVRAFAGPSGSPGTRGGGLPQSEVGLPRLAPAGQKRRGLPEVFCQLNDDNVFDPRYQILRDLVARGAVGPVQSMWLVRGSRLDSTSVLKSQALALDNGGGCLMDYGSHGLAGSWYVLGRHLKPVKVEAAAIDVLFPHRVLEGEPVVLEVDDNARIKVLFEDPATGSWVTLFLEASWTGAHIGPKQMRTGEGGGGFLRIEGDEGVIDGSHQTRITVTRWDGGETLLPVREYPGETISFLQEIGHFIDCVRTGTPPEFDLNFGAEVIALCEAAYLSAIRKQAVTVEEAKEFAREYVRKFGDGEQAEEALLADLLKPYGRKR